MSILVEDERIRAQLGYESLKVVVDNLYQEIHKNNAKTVDKEAQARLLAIFMPEHPLAQC
jgi:hypothetical protein